MGIARHPFGPSGFNPCFSGFTSTTGAGAKSWTDHVGFNPCFSGFTSTTHGPLSNPTPPAWFQSLFFWIHFYNLDTATPGLSAPRVSILVFLDSLLQLVDVALGVFDDAVFQSLFFWIHFYNKRGPAHRNRHRSVSILVFLDSLLQHAPRERGRLTQAEFQSLFFWIHFYNIHRLQSRGRDRLCFNPCFSGFTSTTAHRARL